METNYVITLGVADLKKLLKSAKKSKDKTVSFRVKLVKTVAYDGADRK